MLMGRCCIVLSLIFLTNYDRPACPVWLLPSSQARSQQGDADALLLGSPDSSCTACGVAGRAFIRLASLVCVFASLPSVLPNPYPLPLCYWLRSYCQRG